MTTPPDVSFLAEVIANPHHQYADQPRAFAAVTLGFLGDKDEFPILYRTHEHPIYLADCDALWELLHIL